MDSEQLSVTFIAKLPQKDSALHFICKSLWAPDGISLEILDCHQSNEWEGNISHEELKQTAEELELPYEKFYNECKEALTQNGGTDNFQYLMEENKFTLTKSEQFQIRYIEIDMQSSYNLKNSMTLSAVDLIASLRSKLSGVEEESKELDDKYQSLTKTLEKCLSEKELIETRLLQKFTLLLNAKKDKIAELQDLLLVKSTNRVTGAGSSKRKSTEMLRNSIDENEDDDEDFMRSTQVMTQPVVSLPKRMKFNATNEPLESGTTSATERSSLSARVHENDDANVTTADSADIFDQL